MSHSRGIYAILNTVSNTAYIGSTGRSFSYRWKLHEHLLCKGRHDNCHLQNAWNKYGSAAFDFQVLEEMDDVADIIHHEQTWLDMYRLEMNVYNIQHWIRSPLIPGQGMTEETRRRLSRSLVQFYTTPAGREIVARLADINAVEYPAFYNCCTGEIIPSGKNRARMAKEHGLNESHMGLIARGIRHSHAGWILLKNKDIGPRRPFSRETRRRMSEAAKGRSSPMLGRTHSAETREKIGAACRGKKLSAEHRAAISRSNKGQVIPEWQKKVIGEAQAGEYPAFIHDETKEIIPAGRNLTALSRERGLDVPNIWAVVHGKRNMHHGWRLLET